MLAVNYTGLRDNMKECFDRIADSFEPMIVTRKNENMVIMSQSAYDSLMETVHLVKCEANYEHLQESIAQHRKHQTQEHKLLENTDD